MRYKDTRGLPQYGMTNKFTVSVYGMFIPIPENWNFVGFSPMIIRLARVFRGFNLEGL
jgi:hypothetical protein